MLISFNALNYALYKDKNRQTSPELYSDDEKKKNRPYLVAAAIILLIIEIVFLYFALQMAMSYAKNTTELVIHLLLATFLTIPYVFVNATFNTDVYKSFSRNK